MRLRSRVFRVFTIVMVVLVAGSVLVAAYLQAGTPSQPAAVRVGFSGGSQALEPSFDSVAVALGQTVTVTKVADPATGRSQVQAGTLDMAVSGSATAPTAVVSESLPAMVEIALDAAARGRPHGDSRPHAGSHHVDHGRCPVRARAAHRVLEPV